MNYIIENIDNRRRALGLSIDRLARMADLSHTTLWRLMAHRTDLDQLRLGTLISLAATLKCEAADLLTPRRFTPETAA